MSQESKNNETQNAAAAWSEFQNHAEGQAPRDETDAICAGSRHRIIRDTELVTLGNALSSAVNVLHRYARQNPEVRDAQDEINRAQNLLARVAFLDTRWLPEEHEALLESESNIL